MRKLAVLTSLVLVLALALPAAAQIETKFSGKVQTDLYFNQEDGLWAWGELKSKLEMSYGTEGAIRAVLGLGATESNADGEFGDPSSPLSKSNAINLNVETAYIQADGAWFEGLPSVTTKLGRFGTNYSDWVADLGNRDGIEVSNVSLGPVTVAGLYAWVNEAPMSSDNLFRRKPFVDQVKDEGKRGDAINQFLKEFGEKDWRIAGLNASADLDVVSLSGTFLTTYNDDDSDDRFNDYAVSATVTPIEGLKLEATFAGTNYKVKDWVQRVTKFPDPDDPDYEFETALLEEKGTGYKLSAELTTIPDVTIGLSYWASDDAFNPIYAKLDDKKPVAFPGWDKPNERKGFEVKADTTQAGFDLGATVKRTTDANDKNEATEYEIRVSRDFNGIKGSYKFEDGTDKNKKYLHTVTVETTVDTPIAQAVNIKGTVRLPEDDDLQYAADVTWQAPNGFNVGLHYASYDREDDWGGRDVNKENSGKADGFTLKVGYTFEW